MDVMEMGERLVVYVWDGENGGWFYNKWGGYWDVVQEYIEDIIKHKVNRLNEFEKRFASFSKISLEEAIEKNRIEYFAIINLKEQWVLYVSWFRDGRNEEIVKKYFEKYGNCAVKWNIDMVSDVEVGWKTTFEEIEYVSPIAVV